MAGVFERIKEEFGVFKEPGGVFVDLGSGLGKGIVAGALMHEFDEVIGVEILDGLYQKSLEIKDICTDIVPNILKQPDNPLRFGACPDIKILHLDFNDVSHFPFQLSSTTGLQLTSFSSTPLASKKSSCLKSQRNPRP